MVTQEPHTPRCALPARSTLTSVVPHQGASDVGGERACLGAGIMEIENKLKNESGREATPGDPTTLICRVGWWGCEVKVLQTSGPWARLRVMGMRYALQ